MKTLLIPIDFTDTSLNAIAYAAGFCRQFDFKRILLLKSFYDTVFDGVVVSAGYGGVGTDFRAEERERAEERLEQITRELSLLNTEVEVVALTSEQSLTRAVMQVIRDESPQLLLMGSDTNAYDTDSYVSSHVIEVAKTSPINVVVVPAGQRYQFIKELLVPVDSFSEALLTNIGALAAHPSLQKMEWSLLKTSNSPADEHASDLEALDRVLGAVPHHLFYSQEQKAIEAIINFLHQGKAQMIVALPGKYSFLYRLTHQLISEAICRNTEKPVLLVKQI